MDTIHHKALRRDSHQRAQITTRLHPNRTTRHPVSDQSYRAPPPPPTVIFLSKNRHDANGVSASSRQPPLQLPPIHPNSDSTDQFYPNSATAQLNAVFGRETKSPRQMRPVHPGTADMPRGPVPRFNKLDSVQDLQPRVNPQPAFRRANPEGGFISVSLLVWLNYFLSLIMPA